MQKPLSDSNEQLYKHEGHEHGHPWTQGGGGKGAETSREGEVGKQRGGGADRERERQRERDLLFASRTGFGHRFRQLLNALVVPKLYHRERAETHWVALVCSGTSAACGCGGL